MGFFSGHRLMPIYLNALKQYGFDTSLIPAKLHVAIMEESERDSLSGGDWDGLNEDASEMHCMRSINRVLA